MPEIRVKHIVSFTSEDKKFPAENLLKPEGTSKWKCAAGGEKNASITLQLEKASQIHQIDVGNEGSAFVEVLVMRSDNASDEGQVILSSHSLMTLVESKNWQNPNKVRIFTADMLSKAVTGEKWDRIKVVCTQPFNKVNQFGLSFIKFHSPPDPNAEPPKKQTTLGGFTLKSDADSDIKTGSLFASKEKYKKPETPLTGAAAMRAASRAAEQATPSPGRAPSPATTHSHKTETPKRKYPEDEDRKPTPKSSDKTPMRKQATSISSTSSASSERPPPMKKVKSESSKPSPEVPFKEVMKKVVFVMSGYQNPYRGNLRDKALEMGAKYKGDWGRGCTHLICAFENTPKYQQVAGKGRIVTKDWILECYRKKRLLPWRKFRLGKAGSPSASSGSDTEDEATASTSTKKSPARAEKKTDIIWWFYG